jgi:hypothetical protein
MSSVTVRASWDCIFICSLDSRHSVPESPHRSYIVVDWKDFIHMFRRRQSVFNQLIQVVPYLQYNTPYIYKYTLRTVWIG